MSVINADTITFWKQLAADLSAQRPIPGKLIRVTSGKRKGREGSVLRHQKSKYKGDAFRYGGDAAMHMREMAGRYGYVVLVQDARSTDQWWVDADKVEVIERLTETDPEYA